MNLKISCDDACASDIRVADLATKYKIPATFYIPVEWHSLAIVNGWRPLSLLEAQGIATNHDIGAHTITHRLLTRMPFEEAQYEMLQSKFILEALFKKPVTKFCPPRGYTNKELTDFALRHFESQRTTVGKGLVHVHPKSGVNDNKHWLDYAFEIPEVNELWMHSWELDQHPQEWENLEDYLKEYANIYSKSK